MSNEDKPYRMLVVVVVVVDSVNWSIQAKASRWSDFFHLFSQSVDSFDIATSFTYLFLCCSSFCLSTLLMFSLSLHLWLTPCLHVLFYIAQDTERIKSLQRSGVSGHEIVQMIVKNSATFASKTEFSQVLDELSCALPACADPVCEAFSLCLLCACPHVVGIIAECDVLT